MICFVRAVFGMGMWERVFEGDYSRQFLLEGSVRMGEYFKADVIRSFAMAWCSEVPELKWAKYGVTSLCEYTARRFDFFWGKGLSEGLSGG